MSKELVEITPVGKQPKYCLIWLHGIGMEASEFIGVFMKKPFLELIDEFKFILPNAPSREVTINNGAICQSWFDVKIRNFENPFKDTFSISEIEESTERIQSLISQQIKLFDGDSSRIFIGGFSQGVAMSLHSGLTFSHKLGGIICFSGYKFEITKYAVHNSDIPILIIHGLADKVRSWEGVKDTYNDLVEKPNVRLELIPKMGHFMRDEEPKAIVVAWIKEKLKL